LPVGQSTLNFGDISSPSGWATLDVTGQASILSTSKVEAWIRPEATPEHSLEETLIEPIKISAGNILEGTGFTIYGEVLNGKTYGTYKIDWVWV